MTPAHAHVLVADDQADNRGLLVQLLRRAGYRVSEAADGQAALAVIASDRPDLLLLDLMMPVVDGFGVLAALRDSGGPFLPVVVVSAAIERAERLRALELGANEFLNKPIDADELNLRVRTLLALKAADEANRQARLALSRSNEELQAANEELSMQSEELQAANEELMTQSEELRAQQEELEAMNLELHAINRTIEARVEERTLALQAADRYKDEFLSVISHELRTPLNFITGFASTLDDEVQGSLNPAQHQAVDKILSGAERMLALVDNLLDLARIQSGRLSVSPEPTDFEPVVADAIEHLQPLAERAGVRLRVELAAPTVALIDGPRVGQVLINLVGNAIKFTPRGKTVCVSARVKGGAIVTHVADEGCGIAAADIPRLFQRFGQLDMSTTRHATGTGLGLAICKGLVEAHGGEIGVQSDGPGQGSLFWFTLPNRLAPDQATHEQAGALPQGGPAPADSGDTAAGRA